jgi:hypothetical protein
MSKIDSQKSTINLGKLGKRLIKDDEILVIKDCNLGLIFLESNTDSVNLRRVVFEHINVSDDEALDAHHLMTICKVWDSHEVLIYTTFFFIFPVIFVI